MLKLRNIILGAYGVLLALFLMHILGDFSGPVAGTGDIGFGEYFGYYLSKTLSWNPFPHINFDNDLIGYPYGAVGGLNSWSFEKDFFYFFFQKQFGFGPWIQ